MTLHFFSFASSCDIKYFYINLLNFNEFISSNILATNMMGKHSWIVCLMILIVLLQNTESSIALSKNTIPSSIKQTISSNGSPLQRYRREHSCKETKPDIVPDMNAINETKDHIRMQWLDGDKILMIASDKPSSSVSLDALTTVWIIDATNPDSVLAHNQDEHVKKSILALSVNPLDKSNAVLLATDLRTLYVLHGNTWSVSTFPAAISIAFNTLLSYEVLETVIFHPTNPNYLMLSFGKRIYFSKDTGIEWSEGPDNVVKYQWTSGDTVIYMVLSQSEYSPLYRTDDLFVTQTQLQPHIIKFYFENKILFISNQSRNDPTNKTRTIWVSTDLGDNFNLAHIPEVSLEQYYEISVVTDSYAMLHLGNTSSASGQLFVSDSKFTSYTLSLNDHISQSFYQVKSIRGVYIASVPLPLSSYRVTTWISYNAGGEWQRISHHGCSGNNPCYLNLYVSDVFNKHVPELQSHSNAKGLILGYGAVGEYLDLSDTSTLKLYVSFDGGYEWEESLSNEYQVEIGNYGNLLVGVTPNIGTSCVPISSLKYLHAQGSCWTSVTLPETITDFLYCGFNMEPEASSMKTFFWGVDGVSDKWSFLVVDFTDALDRVCGETDFEDFTPHAATGCLFGYNETFQRVKSDSLCYIGTNKAKLAEHIVSMCQCRQEVDFECDFGYERSPGTNTSCYLIPGYDLSQHCSPEELTYQVNPLGLRLIAGDICTGPDSILKQSTKYCSNWDGGINYIIDFYNSHRTSSLIAGLIVLMLAIVCVCLTLYFILRVWLRKHKSKQTIVYKSLLEAAEEGDNSSSLGESDQENDAELLKF